MSKGSDNHEIMTLNQQADAAALIKDIENALAMQRDDAVRMNVIATLVLRYKEKWPWQQS